MSELKEKPDEKTAFMMLRVGEVDEKLDFQDGRKWNAQFVWPSNPKTPAAHELRLIVSWGKVDGINNNDRALQLAVWSIKEEPTAHDLLLS